MKLINKYKSPNYNERKNNLSIEYIVIHYTAMKSDIEAIKHLCKKKNKVSCHFLINKLGIVFNLVNLNYRAWHAGTSKWRKLEDINSKSIGIEIDNSGHLLNFENFTSLQIISLKKLLLYLKKEFKIKPYNILAHSDIAPYRKIDPGEKFPWEELAKSKLIVLPPKKSKKNLKYVDIYLDKLSLKTIKKRSLYMLSSIGYEIGLALKSKAKFELLIRAYQMHYRRSLINGKLDNETYSILRVHFKQSLTY